MITLAGMAIGKAVEDSYEEGRMRRFFVTLVTLMVLLTGAVAVADVASAHVRDRDKVGLCSGDNYRRHFHDAGIKLGYYYYIEFDYWNGSYIHYDVHKEGYGGTYYDFENKVVNCRYW